MSTIDILTETFNSNFVAYYRSHAAHLNIVGRNFVSDHKLLNDIYDDLQDNIDTLGELIRTLKTKAPNSIMEILSGSRVNDMPMSGDSEMLLSNVYTDVETLIDIHKELIATADDEGYKEISNYAQDRVLILNKFCWMLRSILDDEPDEDADDNFTGMFNRGY